jgi:hypothetical protein
MRCHPVVALLLVGGILAAGSAAEPARQQELRELSVDQAKQIVDKCRGKGYIYLNALESLSPGAAAELARHREYLILTTLRTLSPEAAEALAPFPGKLSLDGIEELSDATAAGLGRCQAKSISLPRLATVSTRGQDSLATAFAALGLPRLRTLTSGPLAERLVAAKQVPAGLVEVSADAARALAKLPGNIQLDTLQALTPEVAAILADRPRGGLSLRGLRTLAPEVATALVRTPGPLVLDGVETVSDDVAEILAARAVAEILAERAGGLSLTGLRDVPHPALLKQLLQTNGLRAARSLPDAAFAAIAASSGARTLDGLTALTVAQAEMLGRHEGPLSLAGITALSDEAARGLLRHRGPLHLPNLTDFSAATLAAIMDHGQMGQRWIDQLQALTAPGARLIAATAQPGLSFNSLKTLSPEAARALATYRGQMLGLDGLTTLDGDTAAALAEFAGQTLVLNNVKQVPPAVAAALAKSRANQLQVNAWYTSLDRNALLTPEFASLVRKCVASGQPLQIDLKNLDGPDGIAVARVLATMPGPLALHGLTTVSADVAAALAEYKGPALSLAGLTSLPAETAAALARCRTWDGNLATLRTLPVETARALAGHRGQQLVLAGLTTITPEAIEALAAYDGGQLYLRVQPLTPELVRTLAACKAWQPTTETLATLTTEAARVLSDMPQWNGNLQGITAIDTPDAVEIARILARRQGPVSLHGLKRISPRTLLALIEKENAFVPLVESLELIPEPDGSPTDDIVLPERFLERQEQQRQQQGPMKTPE